MRVVAVQEVARNSFSGIVANNSNSIKQSCRASSEGSISDNVAFLGIIGFGGEVI
jgi:hypothetical protein